MKLPGRTRARAGTAVVALLLLTGCGQLTPGTAAVVNGSRITHDEVTALADAQCLAADQVAEAGESQSIAISSIKRQSLGLLMDTELSLQFAREENIDVPRGLATAFYNQLEPSIKPLPAEARVVLEDVFRTYAQGRAALVQAGGQATGQQPSLENVQQLLEAGVGARDAWLEEAEIETDPRYAPSPEGYPGGGDASVSRADSEFAKGAASVEPDPKWVSGLPAGQKCG